MTSVSGFGQEGPWRDYVSFAAIGEALSGISGLSGYTGEGALIHGVGVSDPYAGYLAAFSTLAAVHHARATGEGQHVDVSQLEASMQYIADALVELEFTGRPRARATSDDSAMAPHGAFPTRGDDAWIALSVATEEQWCALLGAMETPGWASDARFATPLLRRRNRVALNELVAEWTARFDRHELARDLQARGVPAAPVLAPSDLINDPGLEGRRFFSVRRPSRRRASSVPLLSRANRRRASADQKGRPDPRRGQSLRAHENPGTQRRRDCAPGSGQDHRNPAALLKYRQVRSSRRSSRSARPPLVTALTVALTPITATGFFAAIARAISRTVA